MFMDIGGMTVDNPSLARAPHPYYNVRIKPLGQLGFDADQVKHGNELTCDDLDALRIPWGYTIPEEYIELHEDWSYVWDLGAEALIITNDSHITTIHPGIKTVRDLAITFDVFESSQFVIKRSASAEFDVFLVAAKVMQQKGSRQDVYRWGETDQYLSGSYHIDFCRMIGWLSELENIANGGDQLIVIDQGELYDGEYQPRSILLAAIRELVQSGRYPINILPGQQCQAGQRQLITHQGLMAEAGQLVLIYLFAGKLLQGSAPVFEPWMLYPIFQWFVQGRNISSKNRTFDLSPWWG
jgi:hypothetical protein